MLRCSVRLHFCGISEQTLNHSTYWQQTATQQSHTGKLYKYVLMCILFNLNINQYYSLLSSIHSCNIVYVLGAFEAAYLSMKIKTIYKNNNNIKIIFFQSCLLITLSYSMTLIISSLHWYTDFYAAFSSRASTNTEEIIITIVNAFSPM